MATNTPNYTVDYNDPRFTEVRNEQQSAINNLNSQYKDMLNQNDKVYNDLINANEQYKTEQQTLQQQRADYEQEVINNQKANAEKDFQKQQKASYIDYQQANNQYGSNARAMAQTGLDQSGYSETAQVSMFNAYQNRIATAKESFDRAVTDYNLAIKDIQLQNDSKLMEIAQNALQQKLELTLQQFTTRNQLLQSQMDREYQYNTFYENKYQNVLSQINTENSLAEQVRQFNEKMQFEREQAAQEQANWEKQYALSKASSSNSKNSYNNTTIDKPISKQGTDEYGNSQEIQSKSDYYFKGTKQPQYINGYKLEKVYPGSSFEITANDVQGLVDNEAGIKATNRIWKSKNGELFVWANNYNTYVKLDNNQINSVGAAIKAKGMSLASNIKK